MSIEAAKLSHGLDWTPPITPHRPARPSTPDPVVKQVYSDWQRKMKEDPASGEDLSEFCLKAIILLTESGRKDLAHEIFADVSLKQRWTPMHRAEATKTLNNL